MDEFHRLAGPAGRRARVAQRENVANLIHLMERSPVEAIEKGLYSAVLEWVQESPDLSLVACSPFVGRPDSNPARYALHRHYILGMAAALIEGPGQWPASIDVQAEGVRAALHVFLELGGRASGGSERGMLGAYQSGRIRQWWMDNVRCGDQGLGPEGEEIERGQPFDARLVQSQIRQNLRRIQRCYETELNRDASLQGRIIVEFTIETDGTVSGVRDIVEPALAHSECVVEVVRSFRFTPPPVGGSVSFRYPFVFEPQN